MSAIQSWFITEIILTFIDPIAEILLLKIKYSLLICHDLDFLCVDNEVDISEAIMDLLNSSLGFYSAPSTDICVAT